MLNKLLSLLKDGENFTIFSFLAYVVVLTHLVGFFVINWCWTSLPS